MMNEDQAQYELYLEEKEDNLLYSKWDEEKTSKTEGRVLVPKVARKISIFCLMTGVFAMVGAMYRWGEGPLFTAPPGTDVQLFYAEIIVCGPVSFIAAAGYWKMKKWGLFAGLVSTGIYLYGSAMVYVSVFQAGFPIPLQLVIPPIFGIGLSVVILWWSWGHIDKFQ